MTRWLWLVVAALAALAAACGGGGGGAPTSGDGQVRVVTSLAVFADLVRQVGGERVQVTALLPPGADPHTYQLPPNRVAAIVQADAVFINGLGLEASIEDVLANNAQGRLLRLAEGLPALEVGEGGAEGRRLANPHLWLDVRNAMRYVERIRDELSRLDPEGADLYRGNAQRYLAELAGLDEEIAAMVASIPPQRRKLVVFHDAFPYFARRYGLTLVGFVIESPGREPSAREVADLVAAIGREGVPALFREPQFNARILELAAKDAGVAVGVLYSDAWGGDVNSYAEMMRFNAQQLVKYLGR